MTKKEYQSKLKTILADLRDLKNGTIEFVPGKIYEDSDLLIRTIDNIRFHLLEITDAAQMSF